MSDLKSNAAKLYTFAEYKALIDSASFGGSWDEAALTNTNIDSQVKKFLSEGPENSALIVDTITAEYVTSQYSCNLYWLNSNLAEFNIGFKMVQTNNTILSQLNEGIIELQETNFITYIKRKYIQVANDDNSCFYTIQGVELSSIGGVFILLIIFVVFGVLVDLAQTYIESKKK